MRQSGIKSLYHQATSDSKMRELVIGINPGTLSLGVCVCDRSAKLWFTVLLCWCQDTYAQSEGTRDQTGFRRQSSYDASYGVATTCLLQEEVRFSLPGMFGCCRHCPQHHADHSGVWPHVSRMGANGFKCKFKLSDLPHRFGPTWTELCVPFPFQVILCKTGVQTFIWCLFCDHTYK